MHKLLNILDLKIALKRFIFCSSLLGENPRALFLGLLSWKQKQNKKPDIRKVIFTERIPRSFASSPPPAPAPEFRVSSLRERKRRHTVEFSLSRSDCYCAAHSMRKWSEVVVPVRNTLVIPVGLEGGQGNV